MKVLVKKSKLNALAPEAKGELLAYLVSEGKRHYQLEIAEETSSKYSKLFESAATPKRNGCGCSRKTS